MPQSPLVRAVLIFLLGLTVMLLGLAAWLRLPPENRQAINGGNVSVAGTALVGGSFELTDQHSATRRPEDFRGRYMLVYFGYTFCPDVCPTTLLAMAQALERLEEEAPDLARRVVPIFFTVDPERDTVEVLAAYAPHFHANLVALTGTPEQVAEAARVYRVYYAKADVEGSDDYLMDHSGYIYLMGPEGGYLSHFSHNASADDIAEGLKTQIAR